MSIQQAEDQNCIPLYAKRGIALERGEGVYVYDSEGKRYLDLMTNIGVNILGHAHPAITAAIREQAGKLVSCHRSFYNEARARFAEKLVSTIGSGCVERRLIASLPQKVFFSSSGTESVEAALKFARVASGKPGVISTKWGYHGLTLGSLAVAGFTKYQKPFLPLLENCVQVAYGDPDAIEQVITDQIGAVILEPIQGQGGIVIPPAGYLQAVREVCDQHDLLLIMDEVQTGFRTGSWFSCQHEALVPDIVCISKGIANGLPLGATIVTEEISNKIPKGSHSGTFGGNPLVCAAALATFETIERENLHKHAGAMGNYFISELRGLASSRIREIRGKGLMVAVELKEKCTKYAKLLQEEGVLVIPTGANVLRMLPPLIIQKEHVDEVVEKMGKVLG